MAFEAKYRGNCVTCWTDFDEGDLIVKVDDREYAHLGCAGLSQLATYKSHTQVCTGCFIELPATGVCDQCG